MVYDGPGTLSWTGLPSQVYVNVMRNIRGRYESSADRRSFNATRLQNPLRLLREQKNTLGNIICPTLYSNIYSVWPGTERDNCIIRRVYRRVTLIADESIGPTVFWWPVEFKTRKQNHQNSTARELYAEKYKIFSAKRCY